MTPLPDLDPYLYKAAIEEVCISCFDKTLYKARCCSACICDECYLKWLEKKRECMHCRQDQMDFDTWTANYKKDDPEENREIQEEQARSVMQDITQQFQTVLNNFFGPGGIINNGTGPIGWPGGQVRLENVQLVTNPTEYTIWKTIKESRTNPAYAW